jgi:hypothetical protein
MKMTYRSLRDQLNKFTEDQLDSDVSIMIHHQEFFEMDGNIFFTTEEDEDDPSVGVLDEGHPWFALNDLDLE